MAEEDVEIVRRAYAAFNRGDRDGAVADVAPDAEYIPSEAFPGSRVRRGPDDVKNFMSWLWDEFEDARLDTHEFIDLGDKVRLHDHPRSGKAEWRRGLLGRPAYLGDRRREGHALPGVHERGSGS
jgi:ketosteroid isomerase-like protein